MLHNRYCVFLNTMKQPKEKTQPQKVLDRLKSKDFSDDVKEVIRKKQSYVNREINK